jgi:hypothetical protein
VEYSSVFTSVGIILGSHNYHDKRRTAGVYHFVIVEIDI